MSTWIKLHDNFWEHPKVLAAGEDASLLYVQGLAYCSRNLTDGAISTGALRTLTEKKEARTLARLLVREGLWTETATGWHIHDYLDFQRSKEQIESERDKARERSRKARVTASSRRTFGRTSGEVTPTVRVQETETETDNPPKPPRTFAVTADDYRLGEEQTRTTRDGIALVREQNRLTRKPEVSP